MWYYGDNHLCSPAVVSPKGIPMNWLILRWDHWVCSQLPCSFPEKLHSDSDCVGMGLRWDGIALGLHSDGIALGWDCFGVAFKWDCVGWDCFGIAFEWDEDGMMTHSQLQLTHSLDGDTRSRYAIQGSTNCHLYNWAGNCRHQKGAFGSWKHFQAQFLFTPLHCLLQAINPKWHWPSDWKDSIDNEL